MKHTELILITGIVMLSRPLPLTAGAAETAASRPVSETASGERADAVSVCILDSGCSLKGVQGKNYLGNDTQDLTDATGHGTAVCEILSQAAPEAQIYMLKCFEDYEELPSQETEEAAIIDAIYDAVNVYHADILNMSWTLNTESEALHEALQYASEQGTLLLAAAGNLSLSTPLGSIVYPAGWEEVIGVAGTDIDENGQPVSSLWYLHSEAVFVSADGSCQGERGSSYAVPRVSGILAAHMAGQAGDSLTLEGAKTYLKSIAVDAGEPGYDTVFGWGVVGLS